MLTKIKKVFLLVIFAAFTLVLAGCGDSGKIKKALKNFELDAEVTEDFNLPTADEDVPDSVTVWTSDNEAIKVDGTYAEVIRPATEDVTVVLTATVTLGETTESMEFTVIVKKLEAPTKLTISPVVVNGKFVKSEAEENQYYLVKGFKGQLEIKVPEETMSKEVVFSTGSKKVLSVDAETGVVEGLDYGKATVTAQSTSGNGQYDKIEIIVVEALNQRQVLLNNKKAIEEAMPRFVYEDFALPEAPNKYVDVYYADSEGNEIYDGEYLYKEGIDHEETITCILSYEGEETEFKLGIQVVSDPEKNEFLALDYAKEQLDKIFTPFGGKDGKKIDANFEVPELFGADEAMFDVTVSYDQEILEGAGHPILFTKVGEEGQEKETLVYTKPNDDTKCKVVVYCTTANGNAIVLRYPVKAAGFTKEEIVEYIKAGTLPQVDENGQYSTTGSHITLATADATERFDKVEITWASSNEEVLTAAGKFADPYLDHQEKVTLTATINYAGTIDATFAFKETLEYEYVVNPAANKAQSIALELSNYLEQPEFLDKISYFPFGDLTRNEDKSLVNILPLPNKISDVTTEAMKEYQDYDIVWGSSEEGLISEDHKLMKQYLRYHEAALTYTITDADGNQATNEIIINVGVAKTKDTFYIGGNYAYSQDDKSTGDVLCQLSKFDKPVGQPNDNARKWGFGGNWNGSFGGYTFYIDEVDKETGKTIRYQFYTTLNTIMELGEDFAVNTETKEVTFSNPHGTSNYETNWGLFFVNNSGKDAKIPVAPLSGQPFLDSKDENAAKWETNPYGFAREQGNGFSFDGYRCGFATDAELKVVMGNGENVIQKSLDVNGDNELTEEDYWVTIPAGGYGMTFKSQSNNASFTGRFCKPGITLHMEYFEPFNLSADGNTDGYGEIHD